jgi:hypothetical protein
MKTRTVLAIACMWMALADSDAQVTLQPWVQVFGTVSGQSLGRYVNGQIQSTNFPYRAAVSQTGNTGVYTLETSTDTSVKRVFFGNNILTGNLNRDPYSDLVVNRSDTICIYWGTPTGIDTLNPLLIPSEHPGEFLSAQCVDDIDNDGFADLVATAPAYSPPFQAGKLYVYLNPINSSTPDYATIGDSIGYTLGISCAVGDMNNDGLNDLVVRGAREFGPQSTWFGYIDIYLGVGIDTISLVVHQRLKGFPFNFSGLASFDVNGDGIDDLLWTNRPSPGGIDRIYVHYGGVAFDTVANLVLQNPGVANFGNAIVNAGDMSGDGNIEIAVAASQATITSGFVFIFEGGLRLDDQFDAAVGMQSESDFGRSVSSVGDVTGDGLADIIIGAPTYAFGNNKGYWGIFKGDSTITEVKEGYALPTVFLLHHSYPNPFNPKSTIRYDLNKTAFVTLEVFDILGQRVAVLTNEEQQPGIYRPTFDGTCLASGVYLYHLMATTPDGKTYTDTKKLTLIK